MAFYLVAMVSIGFKAAHLNCLQITFDGLCVCVLPLTKQISIDSPFSQHQEASQREQLEERVKEREISFLVLSLSLSLRLYRTFTQTAGLVVKWTSFLAL